MPTLENCSEVKVLRMRASSLLIWSFAARAGSFWRRGGSFLRRPFEGIRVRAQGFRV
jgi:hypothetical protein